MTVDAPLTDPRPERMTTHEVRRRLEHARSTRLTQLQALEETGHSVDDHLTSMQRDAIRRVLDEIDDAFARVEDGRYGTCLGCADPVPAERLEILPYTPYCVACQRRAAA